MTRRLAEWYVRDTLHRGQEKVYPHSGHVMRVLSPRRLRNRMLCSPRSMFSRRAWSSSEPMVPPYPRRSSCFMSAMMTWGRRCSLKRRVRRKSRYFPVSALYMLSREGVAEPKSSRALLCQQRYFATSRAW